MMRPAGENAHSEQLQRLRLMARLHWVGVASLSLAALLASLVRPNQYQTLLWIAIVPAAYNGLLETYLRTYSRRQRPIAWPGELRVVPHAQIGLDLIMAAVAIHVTGGVESILLPLCLLIVFASGLILSPPATYAQASFALALLATVFGLEYVDLLPHQHLSVGAEPGLYRQGPHVLVTLIFQACFLYVGAYIAGRVGNYLRAQKAQMTQAQVLGESIVDSIALGIIVLDRQGTVLRFNRFMRDRYGWTDGDLGHNVFETRPDLDGIGPRDQFDAIVETGQATEFRNLHRITRQGQEVYQNLWGYPLYRAGEIAGAVVMIEDVTQQKRLEHDLQAQVARRETIAQLSRRISSILELDQLLEDTVALVADAFGYYNVAVFLVDETTGDLVRYTEAGQAGIERPGEYRQAPGAGMVGWVAETGQPLMSGDVREEPHYLGGYLVDTRSELDVPLKYGDHVLGVLNVESVDLDAFHDEDVGTLQILADQVAVAIENARLYARQEEAERAVLRRAEELSVLHRTALAGAEATDVDDLIEQITRILATNLYQENVGFLLLDPETGQLRPHPSYYGVTPAMREIVVPLGTGITGTVAETGEPLLISDVHQAANYLEVSPTVNSELCVPVRIEGRIIGVINVESPEFGGLSQEDLHLVSTIAEHVGIALERLRLFEETRRRNEELAARNAIARAVSRSLEVDEVLDRLHHEVDRLLGPETFLAALYDEADEVIDIALAIEHGQRLPRFSTGLDQAGGLTAWVIKECEPLLIRDLPAELDHLPAEPQHITEPARSWLGVPLVARGRVVGALSVQSFTPFAFDKADERFLSAVADQVAIAVDNARLYEEMRQMALTDGMTGLYNSRHFYAALENELARSLRHEHAVSLIMLDLDDFKKYNDRYGHLAGDDLLRELASLVTDVVRGSDVAARYGGEEFVIILPETTSGDAASMAERLRKTVECHEFKVQDGRTVGRITISVGVASFPEDATDVKNLVNCVDMALLGAKRHKNTVCVYSPD